MSKRASVTLIGGFIVGAVVLASLAVILFGGKNVFRKHEYIIMYFNESVYGLNEGAPVNIRGVQIGSVKKINIIFNTESGDFRVPVLVELNPGSIEQARQLRTEGDEDPIRRLIEKLGLRGQLQLQSILTSQLYIELVFFPESEVAYFGDGSILEVPTVPSKIARLNKVLDKVKIDKVLGDLASTISAVREFVSTPAFTDSMSTLNNTLKSIDTASNNASLAFDDFREKIDVLAQSSDRSLEDISMLTRQMQQSFAQLNRLTGEGSPVLAKLESALEKIGQAAEVIGRLEDAPERYQLEKALQELERASRSVRDMADSIEKDPRALFWGKQYGGSE